MRKPRDLDTELEALAQRAKALKSRRVSQFGELVIATGADELELEVLAGVLLAACAAANPEREAWRKAGAAFFRKDVRPGGEGRRGAPARNGGGVATTNSDEAPG